MTKFKIVDVSKELYFKINKEMEIICFHESMSEFMVLSVE